MAMQIDYSIETLTKKNKYTGWPKKKGYRNCKNSIWDKFDKNTMKHILLIDLCVFNDVTSYIYFNKFM